MTSRPLPALTLALTLAATLTAGCASRNTGAPAAGAAPTLPRGDAATLRYQCADGVRVDVQPLMQLVPELDFYDGPVEVRLAGAAHTLRHVRAGSGVRYENAAVGWEWFGKGDQATLRDTRTNSLLARDCLRMRGAAVSAGTPSPARGK